MDTTVNFDLIDKINEGMKSDLVGACMFCETPLLKSSHNPAAPTYHIQPQYVVIGMPDGQEKIVVPVKAFMACQKCLTTSPYKRKMLESWALIHLDYMKINDRYLAAMQKKAIEEKHKREIQEELKKLQEEGKDKQPPKEDKKDVG